MWAFSLPIHWGITVPLRAIWDTGSGFAMVAQSFLSLPNFSLRMPVLSVFPEIMVDDSSIVFG